MPRSLTRRSSSGCSSLRPGGSAAVLTGQGVSGFRPPLSSSFRSFFIRNCFGFRDSSFSLHPPPSDARQWFPRQLLAQETMNTNRRSRRIDPFYVGLNLDRRWSVPYHDEAVEKARLRFYRFFSRMSRAASSDYGCRFGLRRATSWLHRRVMK
jgi:hypothetical protein